MARVLLCPRRIGARQSRSASLCAPPVRRSVHVAVTGRSDSLCLERRMNTDRALAAWEIISVIVSCLIAEWVVLAFVGANKIVLAIPIALALVLMVYSHGVYGESARELGFRWDNFMAALKVLAVPTV